jgi:hypothetical protein
MKGLALRIERIQSFERIDFFPDSSGSASGLIRLKSTRLFTGRTYFSIDYEINFRKKIKKTGK